MPKLKLPEKLENGGVDKVNIALISQNIDFIKLELSELKSSNALEHKDIRDLIDNKYMTREEFKAKFEPIQKIVFGFVAVILTAVLGAIVALVVNK